MKKIIGVLVLFAVLAGMIPSMAFASSNVVFYNADNGEVVTMLDEVENVYAELKINAKENTESTVYVVHYKKSGMIGEMEEIDKVVSDETGLIDYTTPVFSVEQSKLVKIFVWEGETLEPVLETPAEVVREKEVIPTATVTELDASKVTALPLTFAMNFKADRVIEEQLEAYGDWYADYELTVNKDVTYNANGTEDAYLAGQYDAWSKDWVVVPKGSYLVEANTPVKIMETAEELYGKKGLKYTYREIYERVKDFDCGMFFSKEFMDANPDVVVTLELKMYNPENEEEFYTIGDVYTYTAEDVGNRFYLPTATVTELDTADITDVPLTFAMNFKADDVTTTQLRKYGNWYADYELTVNKDVTYSANGTEDAYLAGQYDEWSKNWVVGPKDTYTIEANKPVRIMEMASELYGKKGFKYTYNEIYNNVKDFDCGMFFTEEFLAANPDLVVTLELKMYNPKSETINFVIGDTYTFTPAN